MWRCQSQCRKFWKGRSRKFLEARSQSQTSYLRLCHLHPWDPACNRQFSYILDLLQKSFGEAYTIVVLNFSIGVALNVWFTTNGMCAKNNTHIYMWCEQAIIEWSWHVISIVACCHSVKLWALAARAFRSQQNGAVTRMWRSCRVQPSHKEHAIGAVWRCKKEEMLLQPFCWRCTECTIHHKWNAKNNTHIHVVQTSNNRVIPMEWSWWVTSNNACEPGEQLIVRANGDNESDCGVEALLIWTCEQLNVMTSVHGEWS